MSRYSLSHLSDVALLRDLAALVATHRATTAALLAHLAEVDRRRLYAKQNCDSLFDYCVRVLKLSEDCAKKRIRAARTARRFPAIYAALADGRLSLSAVLMLSRRLTRQNARELLAAAERKNNLELESLLAERFPQPDVPTVLVPLVAVPAAALATATSRESTIGWAATGSATEGAARPLDACQASAPQPVAPESCTTAGPQIVGPSAGSAPLAIATGAPQAASPAAPPARLAEPPVPPALTTLLSAHSALLRVTLPRATHDKLTRATELLAHAVPGGDVAQVLDRALDALIEKLERRKFGATDKPRKAQPAPPGNRRTIPAAIRRAVARRDDQRCTYVGGGGVRCESRKFLEYDHVIPLAHGGETTVRNLRLRCRAHNQLEADREFGSEFMQHQREHSRQGTTAP